MIKKTTITPARPGDKFKRHLARSLVAAIALAAVSHLHAGWEALATGADFNSKSAFELKYNYNYPWGTLHNGSAIMSAANVSFPTAGTVKLACTRTSGTWINGKFYNYSSATFYWKNQVKIDAAHPVWDISIDAQVPFVTGTWPALWVTPSGAWNCESDIMEDYGSEGIHQNTYQENANPQWLAQTTVPNNPTGWHNYRVVAMMVDGTNVEFHYYIDGIQTSVQTRGNFVGNSLYLLFDYQTFFPGQSSIGGDPTFTGPLYVNLKNLKVSDLNVSGVAGGPLANGTYKIVVRHDGKALDVSGSAGGSNNNTPTIQWTYGGGANQRWHAYHLGNNQYSLFSRSSGRTLTVNSGSTADGAGTSIYDYSGANWQKWTFTWTSTGYCRLTSVNSGKVLDVSGASTADGAGTVQWGWTGANNQQWIFQAP